MCHAPFAGRTGSGRILIGHIGQLRIRAKDGDAGARAMLSVYGTRGAFAASRCRPRINPQI